MKWSGEERRAFYELWGEEPPPRGLGLVWEHLSHALGEERRLRRIDALVLGGDPVVVALLQRAQARHAPTSHVVWEAPSFWGATAYPWLAHPETVARVCDLLGRPPVADLASVLEAIRGEAGLMVEVRGGSWRRAAGPVRYAPVDSGGWVWVVDPPSVSHPGQPAQGPVEAQLVSLHERSVRGVEVWPQRCSVMMGGCASSVVRAGPDKWKKKVEKDAFMEDFGLPYPGNGSISWARSLWWERIEALVRSPFLSDGDTRCA